MKESGEGGERSRGGPRVLVVVPWINDMMGGSVTAALAVAQLMDAFADVTLLAAERKGAVDAPREVRRSLAPVLGRFGVSYGIWSWLERHCKDFDLVVSNSVFDGMALAASVLTRRWRVPLLLWPHGSLDPYDLQKHETVKQMTAPLLWKPMVRNAAGIVFTTEAEQRRANTFREAASGYVLPLPVEVPPASMESSSKARARLDLPQHKRLLLFLGRLDRKKRLPLLLESMANRRLEDVHLAVAGGGERPYELELHRLARQLGVGDRVHWLGWLTGRPKLDAFQAADCFALVSDNENFGIAAIEAVQMGCRVVLSDGVFVASELAARRAAVVVEPNAGEVAREVRKVMDGEGRLAPIDERVQFARHRWSRHALSEEYQKVVQTVLDRRQPQIPK